MDIRRNKTTKAAGFILIFLFLTLPCIAQAPKEFLAGGVAYDRFGSPQISAWFSYANQAADSRVYYFTTYDIRSASDIVYQAQTSIRPGLAFKLFEYGRVSLYGLGDIGFAYTSNNLGSAFGGGLVAGIDLGKGWAFILPIRVIKTFATERREVIEFGIGWGRR